MSFKFHLGGGTYDASQDPEFFEEMALSNAQEAIAEAMERGKVSRTELARRLGKSKSAVTRMLSDGRNLTVRSVGRIFFALGREMQISSQTIESSTDQVEGQVHTVKIKNPVFRKMRHVEFKLVNTEEPDGKVNESFAA